MKNKYEVSYICNFYDDHTDTIETNVLKKFITYAKSEKQAVNNIRFRTGLKEKIIEYSYSFVEKYYFKAVVI